MSEPPAELSAMTNRELRIARDDIGDRLAHGPLTPEGRLELEQRLSEVNAVMGQRGQITETRSRSSS